MVYFRLRGVQIGQVRETVIRLSASAYDTVMSKYDQGQSADDCPDVLRQLPLNVIARTIDDVDRIVVAKAIRTSLLSSNLYGNSTSFWTMSHGLHGYLPPHMRRVMCSTWAWCPCLLDAGWCLDSGVMTNSRLQGPGGEGAAGHPHVRRDEPGVPRHILAVDCDAVPDEQDGGVCHRPGLRRRHRGRCQAGRAMDRRLGQGKATSTLLRTIFAGCSALHHLSRAG